MNSSPDTISQYSHRTKLLEDLKNRPTRESLEPVKAVANEILPDQSEIPIVQVVGSNGKGSVIYYTEQLLNISGLETVSYTSPHLEVVEERLRYNSEKISSVELETLLSNISNQFDVTLTPFERLFMASLQLTKERNPDVLLLEAGMGGRWDATSAVASNYTVLASVDYEHTQFLGEKLNEIFDEQTQQIQKGTILILPKLNDIALNNSYQNLISNKNLTGLCLEQRSTPDETSRRLSLMLTKLLSSEDTKYLSTKLKSLCRPPGRKEVVEFKNTQALLDVAHTPEAINEWIQFTERNFDCEVMYLFGLLEGKEKEKILRILENKVDPENLCFTKPPTSRAEDPYELTEKWPGSSLPRIIPTPEEALEKLTENNSEPPLISVAGTFHLVSTVKNYVQ